MTTISREIEINASKQEVWNAIANFGDICHASPGVLKSHVTSEQKDGVGATRHCDFAMNGATAEERITKWNEGESLTIEVYDLQKMPGIDKMEAEFAVRTENDKTILRANLNYSMKNVMFDAMNSMMVKRMNTKLWNKVLAGHKKYIETGERVVKETSLEIDKVLVIA
ncbi:MAG: carbon monoxide dehydrogenase subunit G [Arenicella sp.]|jgi:carbon monoxide dehydrogenase subunit G